MRDFCHMLTLRQTDFSAADLDQIRFIFQEYADALGINLSFQNFEQELQTLAQVYGPPRGCVLLAENEHQRVVGCVAVKPLKEAGVCEMKRLYVSPSQRGTGLGRQLAEAIITFAREAEYTTMKLDSLQSLTAALRLYEQLGFVTTAPYVYNPLPEAVYLEKSLR